MTDDVLSKLWNYFEERYYTCLICGGGDCSSCDGFLKLSEKGKRIKKYLKHKRSG